MAGLTSQGFERKTYDDLLSSMQERAKNLFGEDINLSDRSPLGIFIKVIAWFLGVLWQVAEAVYNSAFIDTATGVHLDRAAKYAGISRRLAEKATGVVTFTGDNGVIIPAGYVIQTVDEIQFTTNSSVTISGGTAISGVTAVVSGVSGNVPANTIIDILSPISGLESVINLNEATGGINKETDSEFRDRYYKSISKGGASTSDSIRANLLSVTGVRAVLVVENDTNAVDSDDRPAKCFECYVLGGTEQDISKTIFGSKAAGIQAYGTTVVAVLDMAGFPHNVGFTYANHHNIYANVILSTNSSFPSDGLTQVRTNIIKYIGGEDSDGNIYVGLNMGKSVIYNKIIEAVYKTPGVDDVDLELSEDGETFVAQNLDMLSTEVAEALYSDIIVTKE